MGLGSGKRYYVICYNGDNSNIYNHMKGDAMYCHTREDPNGSQAEVTLPKGMRPQDLKYKQKVLIRVDGEERDAVVDLIVPAFWGGPAKAFQHYDKTRELYHVNVKLVWQKRDGSWNESRDVREATKAEFLAWRKEFNGDKAPTPMP